MNDDRRFVYCHCCRAELRRSRASERSLAADPVGAVADGHLDLASDLDTETDIAVVHQFGPATRTMASIWRLIP